MTRAEKAALKTYPEKWFRDIDGDSYDTNRRERTAFAEGYEQAEKDLAPLFEAAMIVYEAWNGGTMNDVRKGMVELEEQIKEAKK